MARRNKKIVDCSQFGDLEDDDEDFACIAALSSKKSRTQLKEPKKEKKKKQQPHKEVTLSQKQTASKRISLDDKRYQRDLEVALALSVKENSANILDVQNSEKQDRNIESEGVPRRPLFSNCSVNSELLGLNHVIVDEIAKDDCGQKTASSKVPPHQNKLLSIDSDDREHASDSKPESVPSDESEEDSDYSEGDDEDFATEKKKAKRNKKKTKAKMPTEREKKTPKSKINTAVSPVVSPSPITKQKSEPTQKTISSSSGPVGRPLHTSSPVTDKKPKWIPPAASGSSNNSMKYVSVKSPTQYLRLGLSRLARVKPLHPSTASG